MLKWGCQQSVRGNKRRDLLRIWLFRSALNQSTISCRPDSLLLRICSRWGYRSLVADACLAPTHHLELLQHQNTPAVEFVQLKWLRIGDLKCHYDALWGNFEPSHTLQLRRRLTLHRLGICVSWQWIIAKLRWQVTFDSVRRSYQRSNIWIMWGPADNWLALVNSFSREKSTLTSIRIYWPALAIILFNRLQT